MASYQLSLLKLAQEVYIGGLVLVTIAIFLVALSLRATVAFFLVGRGKAWKRVWGVHVAFHVIYTRGLCF
jgi:hypothetical protein